jgi:hypothetical protein
MSQPALIKAAANFVAISSALNQRALDEVNVHRAAQEKAASLRDGVLKDMLDVGCVEPHQKQAAEAMLASHAETLGLLKEAMSVIARQQEDLKKAAMQLGAGEDDPKPTTLGKQASDSVNDGYVGRRTGEKKASDLAFEKILHNPLPA